jgi:hypothetical protein
VFARERCAELSMADVPPSGWGPRPVTYTERGRVEADAFRMWSPEDNPRLRCRPTSIIFDWTFDGAINRIVQAVMRRHFRVKGEDARA